MAGIGFELKRLYNKEGFTNKVLASVQSLFVIFGPYLINILLMLLLLLISRQQQTESYIFNEFLSILVYGFIFSQIITSGASMSLTKFVSDQLYEKNTDKLLFPFLLTTMTSLLVTFLVIIYLSRGIDIERNLLYLIYTLYSLLIILRYQTVYLSALKNYQILSYIYLATFILIIPMFYLANNLGISNVIYVYFLSFIGVLFLCVVSLMTVIYGMLPKQVNSVKEYLKTVKKTRLVRLMNVLLTLSIFAAIGFYWYTPDATVYYEIFKTNPKYDYTFFIANLSIIPSMIYFVVGIETQLFVHVRKFFDTLNGNYPLDTIESERKLIISVVRRELQVFTFVQFASTLSFLLVAYIFLGRTFSAEQLTVMSYYLFGTMLFAITQVIIFILLYFAAFKEAMYVGLALFGATLITNGFVAYFGLIQPALMLVYSCSVSLIVAIMVLERYLKNIYYNIYR